MTAGTPTRRFDQIAISPRGQAVRQGEGQRATERMRVAFQVEAEDRIHSSMEGRRDRLPDLTAAIGMAIAMSSQDPNGTTRNTKAGVGLGGLKATDV